MEIPKNLDTWILAGQSNMEGAGLLCDALQPDARIFSFTSAGNWEVACEPLHWFWESFTPVHKNLMRPGLPEDQQQMSDAELAKLQRENRITGAGLGMSFAVAMSDALGRPIGLIPAAHGGTSLDQWSEKLKDQGGASLYGAMIERAKRSGASIRGVLWYQGESDCSPELAVTYADRFENWIKAVRSDLGIPDLPVIVVQLGRFSPSGDQNGTWWDVVREVLRTLPDRDPNTAAAPAIDLGLEDCIHVNTEGQIRLGKRLARLALRLSGRTDISAGPQPVKVEKFPMFYDMGGLKLRLSGVTGSLSPKFHMSGFQLCGPDGKPTTENTVMDARVDPDDPTSIRLILNFPPADGFQLAYGLGYNPYCNVVDDADMALPSFAPMKIE